MKERFYRLRNRSGDPDTVREKSADSVAAGPFDALPEPEEPFPSEEKERRALTVSELTGRIQDLLKESFGSVWVEGEVSQPTISSKGHMYFTLKDADAVLSCVVWRDARAAIKFNLEQGMKVICFGRIDVYAARGSYQLYVMQIEPKGIGALQLAFDQMKAKLEREGFFSEERKRPLPIFPERIGIVTSPTGAAIQDILKILQGRVQVVLRPARVQGEGSAEAIAGGIKELNRVEELDLLIVGRGGGSAEDLWAFNEEAVARAIFQSRLPVISAVGHERDWSIADFTADLRAPTPTKAAEMVIARRQEAIERLLAALDEPAFTEPAEWLTGYTDRLEECQEQLVGYLEEPVLHAAQRLRVVQERLAACSPQSLILREAERLHRLGLSLEIGMEHSLTQTAQRITGLAGRLHALSPLAVLGRGYSITFDKRGRILKSAQEVQRGDVLETTLHRGRVTSRVETTESKEV